MLEVDTKDEEVEVVVLVAVLEVAADSVVVEITVVEDFEAGK